MISLCNVCYKIITKIIVNQIKPILIILFGPTQSNFVSERHITDDIIIVQEVIYSMKKKADRKGFIAIKVNLEKAYDDRLCVGYT